MTLDALPVDEINFYNGYAIFKINGKNVLLEDRRLVENNTRIPLANIVGNSIVWNAHAIASFDKIPVTKK